MDETATILIVEDDPDIAAALHRGLAARGYRARHEGAVEPALAALEDPAIAAAIIDVMIGEESGLDLVRRARAAGFRGPLLMLSALADVEDRTRGIEAGADDYVVKPFVFEELLARVEVQLRRAPAPRQQLQLDPEAREVRIGQKAVALTEREFQLIRFLAERRGEIASRWDILAALWGGESGASENVVDVYVGYLRRKLAIFSEDEIEIKTIRNKGFCLSA